MSQDVEDVQRFADALNADDTAGFVAIWDPECEFFSVTGSQMDGTPYPGHEGIRRYREEAAEMWTTLRFDPSGSCRAEATTSWWPSVAYETPPFP